MNLRLGRLGKVAGVGGIALGTMVLILDPLIGTISTLSSEQQSGAVWLIAIGCFGIGARDHGLACRQLVRRQEGFDEGSSVAGRDCSRYRYRLRHPPSRSATGFAPS